jgi:hypothetical protein
VGPVAEASRVLLECVRPVGQPERKGPENPAGWACKEPRASHGVRVETIKGFHLEASGQRGRRGSNPQPSDRQSE